MNRLYAETLMADILSTQAEIARGNDYAAGVGLGDLRLLLKEYATTNFVIVRVAPDKRPFCVDSTVVAPWIDRLLADGTWQTGEDRQHQNLRKLARVMG